jgi:hypothetical protein
LPLPDAASRVSTAYFSHSHMRATAHCPPGWGWPRLRSGTGLSHPAMLSRAALLMRMRIRSFPLRLIADDGDATPHPFFRGSEAFRFVCFSRIAFGDFSHTSGAKVFAGRFSEGVSGLNSQPGTYFFKALKLAELFDNNNSPAHRQPLFDASKEKKGERVARLQRFRVSRP